MRAVIVAGGLGTRMASSLPKSLQPIGGRPLLLRQLDLLARHNIHEVTLCTGHGAEQVEEITAGLRVTCVRETTPLGSGGCLRSLGSETLLVIFGDVLVDMDLTHLLNWHRERGASATIVCHPNDHPQDSDLVETDPEGRVTRLHPKPHPPNVLARNQVSAGVFVLEPTVVRSIPPAGPVDLVHGVLAPAIEQNEAIFGFTTSEYLKDIGTPSRRALAEEDWLSGRVVASRRSNPRPTAFVDRDGTLNRHNGFISTPEQVELLPGVGAAVRRLNRRGILVLVVTNQSVVARGLTDEAGLARINGRLEQLLGQEGAYVDGILSCSHHPDAGYPEEVTRYKIQCDCRKPATGLLRSALSNWNVDLARSAMFGDTWRDVEMARAFGLPCLVVGEAVGISDHDRPPCFLGLPEAIERWITSYPEGAGLSDPCMESRL